jgi:hypothetical protein
MKKLIALAFILINFPAIAKEELKPADAVDYCISEVHKYKTKESYNQEFYLNFDAYYNPVTGMVYNNARLNGDEPPKFLFNKCMTKIGFPLK